MIVNAVKVLIGLMILKWIVYSITGIFIPDVVVFGFVALHVMSNKPLMKKFEETSRDFIDGVSESVNN
jgi:uncharacterized ion transporter superfamily protein YfcC